MNSPSANSTVADPRRPAIRTREVGWPVIVLAIVVTVAVLTLVPLLKRTDALARVVSPAWLDNLVTFGVLLLLVAGGIIMGAGRLRASDLGLGSRKLVQGIVVISGVWLVNQVIGAVTGLMTQGTVTTHPSWSSPGVGPTLLWTAVMLFGTALFEEIAFRGFLFPQLALKAGGDRRSGFWMALLVSQVVFAAAHLPGHLMIRNLSGAMLWTPMAMQMVAGILLALLYLRSRNLWIAVGIHGMANAPTPLVTGTLPWEILLVALLVSWPWLTRRPRVRGLAGIERVAG